MRLRITTDTSLHDADELEGYIAWQEIEVQDLDDAYDLRVIGTARAGIVNSFYLSDKVRRTKHPDRDEIEPLRELFLAKDPYKFGADALYFSGVKISREFQGRNIELAVVRRVCDVVGIGCSLAAIAVETPEEIALWARLRFEKTPGTSTLVHLDLDSDTPRIAEEGDTGYFVVVPNMAGSDIRNQN